MGNRDFCPDLQFPGEPPDDAMAHYSIAPELPEGLYFENTTGTITGKPKAATDGLVSYTVMVDTGLEIHIQIEVSEPSDMLQQFVVPAVFVIVFIEYMRRMFFTGAPQELPAAQPEAPAANRGHIEHLAAQSPFRAVR